MSFVVILTNLVSFVRLLKVKEAIHVNRRQMDINRHQQCILDASRSEIEGMKRGLTEERKNLLHHQSHTAESVSKADSTIKMLQEEIKSVSRIQNVKKLNI